MAKQKPLFKNEIEKKETKDKRNEIIRELLRPHKTIRDAIHEDIMITKLETTIIDTEEFQRLRKIRQLGPTHLVYPSANHTRFEHSLGTLYTTQYLFEFALKNPFKDPQVYMYVDLPYFIMHYPPTTITYSDALITNYHVLLTRICALLHDLAHIPFGHTLENEGFLFDEQWEDDERVKHFLNDDSTIGKIIIDELSKSGIDGKQFLQEVRNILTAKSEDIENLPYPFVSDIINNTICGDLLDYLSRDLYFSGLRETYDKRFLSYFYIGMNNGKARLILRLLKPSTGKVRRDVFSETLHLLRLRYSLAEKVYYHHAKVSASAMIISAVTSAIKNKTLSKRDLFTIGDDELLSLLTKDDIGNFIVNNLKQRKLYKPVYALKYTEPLIGDIGFQKKNEIKESLKNKENRYNAERALERANMLERGQIVVYCPGPEMGQKAVKTLSEWNGTIGSLDAIMEEDRRNEIEMSIVKKHLNLWSMYVFVDRTLSEEIKANVASDGAKFFQLSNEIEIDEYRLDRPNHWERFEATVEEELGVILSSKERAEIKKMIGRYVGEDRFGIPAYDEYKSAVENMKKGKK